MPAHRRARGRGLAGDRSASPSLPAATGAPVAPGALTAARRTGVISTGSVGRWRRDLSDEGLASVLRIAGDRLRELGYPTGEG